jgi:hypothetical protein
MGQGQSIETFDYEHVNKLLKGSTQYITDQWQSSTSNGKTCYWMPTNHHLKVVVDKDFWPLTHEIDGLTIGHHYVFINVNKNIFPYNVDNDQFIGKTPAPSVDDFLGKWQELVKSAESAASSTPEQQKQAQESAKTAVAERKVTEVRSRGATQTREKTTRQTNQQTENQYGGAACLTDEDLTQIAILIQQSLKPLEDKINALDKLIKCYRQCQSQTS